MATVREIHEFRGVARVVFDEREPLKLRARDLARFPLTPGEEVDADAYADRVAAAQLAEAYEAALNRLGFCARTERELARALISKGFVGPAVQAVVERLRANGLLDDRRYAERAVETRLDRDVGVYALRRKLRAKGIADEDAEAALSRLDAEQQAGAARREARRLGRKYEGLPAREAKAKLSQALARRGFSWEAIHEALEDMEDGEDWT